MEQQFVESYNESNVILIRDRIKEYLKSFPARKISCIALAGNGTQAIVVYEGFF